MKKKKILVLAGLTGALGLGLMGCASPTTAKTTDREVSSVVDEEPTPEGSPTPAGLPRPPGIPPGAQGLPRPMGVTPNPRGMPPPQGMPVGLPRPMGMPVQTDAVCRRAARAYALHAASTRIEYSENCEIESTNPRRLNEEYEISVSCGSEGTIDYTVLTKAKVTEKGMPGCKIKRSHVLN